MFGSPRARGAGFVPDAARTARTQALEAHPTLQTTVAQVLALVVIASFFLASRGEHRGAAVRREGKA